MFGVLGVAVDAQARAKRDQELYKTQHGCLKTEIEVIASLDCSRTHNMLGWGRGLGKG